MSTDTIYLRTALFSFGSDDSHVPNNTMALRGTANDPKNGILSVDVTECLDGRGRTLGTVTITLGLPLSKIDHILYAGT